jgi:oxygen-independent coproporphyrinogen III oxidase
MSALIEAKTSTLQEFLDAEVLKQRSDSTKQYAAYTYAYPHKSAYRPLAQALPLADVWQQENRNDLFLYVHIPFCHYRCGFCNLFALGAPKAEWVEGFLSSLQRQIRVTAQALGPHRITRMAIGGGTPSYLSVPQFERLLANLHQHFNLVAPNAAFALEVAPDSATPERLRSYKNAGVTRLSMGVQSFVDAELDALARPRQRDEVIAAVHAIRELGFDELNLDLIYGIEGQTEASFLTSLESILAFQSEELYLYPLYVRKLTGLAKAARTRGLSQRAELYQAGVRRLTESGYSQQSMRMFRKAKPVLDSNSASYSFACQTLGTVGLGVGARSYTQALHYSEEYAVSRAASQAVLHAYNQRSESDFSHARYGFSLDMDERKRRYLLQSLLIWPGVDIAGYCAQFGSELLDDFPQLATLIEQSFATYKCSSSEAVAPYKNQGELRFFALTDAGMAHADAIGPWLYSNAVRAQMDAYDWR